MNDYISLVELTRPLDRNGICRLSRHACLEIHNVRWRRLYLAADGLKLLCWYQALDAESVRLVLRQTGWPEAAVRPVHPMVESPGERSPDSEERMVFEWDEPVHDRGAAASLGARISAALSEANSFCPVLFEPKSGLPLLAVVTVPEAPALEHYLNTAGLKPSGTWLGLELDPSPRRLFEPDAKPLQPGIHPGSIGRLPFAAVQARQGIRGSGPEPLDAVIIGAGISGICMLQRLERMGLRSRLYESASDIGGVWHWNRYPGARVDSEVYTYGFSFSEELLAEWQWRELFASQAEILDYLRYVVERFNLRRRMRFDAPVTAATFDEHEGVWRIRTGTGENLRARFLLAASGSLTMPQLPDYPGMSLFAGPSCHTSRWPEAGIDLHGKRVGVVGTGASGVQVIQSIAELVKQLLVFQRTPTYCIPQRNRPLDSTDRERIRRDWANILAACRESYGGFVHTFDPRSGLAVSAQEREATFEKLWRTPGFAFWFGNFADLLMNEDVNAHASEFLRRKIRERVNDPELARKLLPDHPFGSKRVPLENGYYEVYNRDNVRLVDLRETPVLRITPAGIETVNASYPLDVIIYATGFDAGTGALNRIDIRGKHGLALADKWRHGAETFLGLLVSGFPNLFIVNGPHNAAALCNAGRCIEQNVDWIARCIEQMRQHGLTRVEPSLEAEREWTDHVYETADASILAKMTNSWFFGANTPGKPRRATIYAAGAREYREHCEAVAASGYTGLIVS